MQIKDMFEKQIDRDIKGVIKVGQSDEEKRISGIGRICSNKRIIKTFP